MSYREYKVKQILDEHDGDTIHVHIDLGCRFCGEIHLRLMGVFAQELSKPGGPDARAFVVGWINDRVTAGHTFKAWTTLSVNDNEVESLGRWVGDLEDVNTGEHLCTAMMAFLLAHPEDAGGIGSH